MSPPIIKYALQLVDAVDINIEILATIKDVSKSVYIIADEFTQKDLDKYSTILNSSTQKVWMSNADAPNARLRPVMAASTSEYPKGLKFTTFSQKSDSTRGSSLKSTPSSV
ncbi:hypothetical protein OEA41_010209 [Lepraria neglecta]|uniref:Uncharacterized protein n=1 Tax=Lepraria neglecta TaxID=209136 RepID=A0AAD9YW07_9LECA|nr:hypothetical protein OEA41_010209 [Lepraria neglecta]